MPTSTRQPAAVPHTDIASLEHDDREHVVAHARALAALGYRVVPTCYPTDPGRCVQHGACGKSAGKRPLRAGFNDTIDRPQTPDEAAALITAAWPCNLALVIGSSLLVIEADSPAADQELISLGGTALTATPTRLGRPGRGRGYLFSCAPASLGRRTKLGTSGAIDVLTAGSIFIVPPSVHATGHRYPWAPGCAPWEAAPVQIPESLLALARTHGTPAPGLHPCQPNRPADPRVAQLAAHVRPHASSEVVRFIRADRLVAQLWRGEGKTAGDTSRSGLDFSLAKRLHRLHVPLQEIANALAVRPESHSSNPTYCARTALAGAGEHR